MKNLTTKKEAVQQGNTKAISKGLAALGEVPLSEENFFRFEEAKRECGGPIVWRKRKEAEARDLLALSEISPHFNVQMLDLRETLRATTEMRVPVPLRPDEDGKLRTGNHVVLGISYPENAIRVPLPGYAFVQILFPVDVWHANVSSEIVQLLCLGDKLPAGIKLRDVVLMSYGALSMQTVMIDETDPSGVVNPEATFWWQHNTDLIPLTQEPFLGAR
jgi:hypothetical protein